MIPSLAATVLLVLLCGGAPGIRLQSVAAAKPRYTNSWAVEVSGGSLAADELANKHGFVNLGQIGNLRDFYHFVLVRDGPGGPVGERSLLPIETGSEPDSGKAVQLLSEENVGYVSQQKLKRQVKKDYTAPSDPQWSSQWALSNTGQTYGPAGIDLKVEPAWIQGITGQGVVVGFVDDGLEHSHPDLAPNYDSSASHDFANDDSDPTPDSCWYCDEENRHGTSCAGEVGMAKDNGNCGVGVAYDCKIGGLKVDLSESSDLTEASALGYNNQHIDIYSNSWGPTDFGFFVSGPETLTQKALQTAVEEGRDGKGSIIVFAAGNGGRYYDSCAADGYVSSIYTIAVGSADQSARQADYDEQCASKMAVTFSYNSDTFPDVDDSWDPYRQIRTTTLNGGCTDDFTGTSASAPLMSGVVALTLQANPNLSWRDMQYLIAYTSDHTILTGGEWTTNGGGLRVSHKFGFGAIDAEAMVTRAKRWTNVPEQRSYSTIPHVSDHTAHNNDPISVTYTIGSSSHISFLEHVVVKMSLSLGGYSTGYDYYDLFDYLDYYDYYDYKNDIPGDEAEGQQEQQKHNNDQLKYNLGESARDNMGRDVYDWLQDQHTRRGDIKIELTSPQGTTSTLLPYRNYDFVNEEGYDNWPFMSVHFWGENPAGTWTLKVTFKSRTGYVSMSDLSVKLYGTSQIPESVSSIPTQCDPKCSRGCSGLGPGGCDSCSNLRVSSTLECVDNCPANTLLYKNYCIAPDGVDIPTSSSSPPTTENPSYSSNTEQDNTGQDNTGQDTEVKGATKGSNKSPDVIIVIAGVVPAVVFVAFLVIVTTGVLCYCRYHRQRRSGARFSFVPLHEPKDQVTV